AAGRPLDGGASAALRGSSERASAPAVPHTATVLATRSAIGVALHMRPATHTLVRIASSHCLPPPKPAPGSRASGLSRLHARGLQSVLTRGRGPSRPLPAAPARKRGLGSPRCARSDRAAGSGPPLARA